MEDAHGSTGMVQQPGAGGPPTTIDVNTPDKLIDALNRATAGVTIRLSSGEYEVEKPLLVGVGVTLQGAGVMQPEQGLPVGFKQGTTTKITASTRLAGNLLTLGDGSAVRGLVLQGAPPPDPPQRVPEDDEGRGGNVVAVASGGKGVSVSATIDECVLINKITSGGVTDGPTGGGILAYTRNPKRGNPPLAPHEDASVTVTVKRSIVDTPEGGKAVLAMNFASGGAVTIKLKQNKVGGPLDVIGGLSRPDTVVFATTTIDSEGNLYSQPQSGGEAWQIIGGSGPPPSVAAGPNSHSDSNSARAESRNDQIKDFPVGIVAIGGQRTTSGTCSHNEVKLDLINMTLATKPPPPPPPAAARDFEFEGARSFGAFPPGNGNIVHARIQNTTGSGPRDNRYANGGTGNQLVFVGTRRAFTDSNPTVNPAPRATFFEHGSS